ncbi:MAG TPA: amidohydrolase family protein [Patescibacteria group bacterium]|nr:amidohydrolase family protein [Patescibacteria group bacterium]
MSVGIRGKFIVGFNGEEHRLLRDGVVIYEGNRIVHVGKSYSGQVDSWIDASESLVIPGLINTHLHAATSPKDKSFLEDIGVRPLYGSNLGENLTALNMAMTREDREVYAKYSLVECLRSGNTTVVEIGMVSALGEEKTVEIVDKMGLRACEGHALGDGSLARSGMYNFETKWRGLEAGMEGLDRATAFAEKYRGAADGRLMPAFYPGSVMTCSADFQKEIRGRADKLRIPISIHAGEWVVEFQNMLRMYGRTPIEFMHDTGLLGPNLILGHCWAIAGHPLVAYPSVGGGDLQLIAEAGATVSHDPTVFVKRGNRMHSHSRYVAAGVNVSIGTDTVPQDMINEMRIASYVSKLADWDPYSGSSREIFNSATLSGSKAIGRPDIGRLTPGALADIVIINMATLNNVPCRDPIRNLVNCTQRSDVRTVIVDGKTLVEEGRLLHVDEEKLVKEAQHCGERIWEKIPGFHHFHRTADEVSPQSFKPWDG